MVLGGIFYTAIGPKRIMMFAFVAHTLGILLTIYSGGYTRTIDLHVIYWAWQRMYGSSM